MQRLFPILAALVALTTVSTAWAHARPTASQPSPGGRLDSSPAQVAIDYDSRIVLAGSSITLLDMAGNPVPTSPDVTGSETRASVSPTATSSSCCCGQ